jgi:catechol 2,3-dioxygenase-like lactoylglutathione lyase family enzyme
MNSTPRLSHLIYYVSNPISSAERWEKLLGLTRKMTHEFAIYTESAGLGLILAFADQGLAEANYPGDTRLRNGSGNAEIDFEVEDVDAWHARALELGFRSVASPTDQEWGQRTCYLEDPNGIRVSFGTAG